MKYFARHAGMVGSASQRKLRERETLCVAATPEPQVETLTGAYGQRGPADQAASAASFAMRAGGRFDLHTRTTDNVEPILDYRVFCRAADRCVAEVIQNIRIGTKTWLACLNPHSFVVSRSEPGFADALASADWLVPDGIGIVLASRLLGGHIRDRITGTDIFSKVNSGLDRESGSVFLLGSSEETLDAMTGRMHAEWPNLRIVGKLSPPYRESFSDSENADMIHAINAARPDVLWVAMTAPKQEQWIHDNLQRLDVKFASAIGAVFDFYAGRVRRPAPVFQRLGLEWLPRLLQEPRRLWRRTLVSAPIFITAVLKARFARQSS